MKTKAEYSIALLPGDGIGPEVTAAAVRVLRALGAPHFAFTEISVGAGQYLRSGDPMPADTLAQLTRHDAVLLGAMGLPGVRWPGGAEMTPQLDLRERLDLYCGLRPIYLYHGEDSPLRGMRAGEIDLMIVRESTEGLFSSRKEICDLNADAAEDRLLVTRQGSERVIHSAFEQARLRRKHVTLVDKANVLPSMVYFREVFDRVAREYPEIETNRVYVDAAALYLVRRPQMFDVIVTENMFGDILSDLAAALVGGMGMAPSADIVGRYAVFQPAHGSAPDIAGRGIANPVAAILSAGMMLHWLGAAAAAERIRTAVRTIFGDPLARTVDMGGSLSSAQMTDAILAALP